MVEAERENREKQAWLPEGMIVDPHDVVVKEENEGDWKEQRGIPPFKSEIQKKAHYVPTKRKGRRRVFPRKEAQRRKYLSYYDRQTLREIGR